MQSWRPSTTVEWGELGSLVGAILGGLLGLFADGATGAADGAGLGAGAGGGIGLGYGYRLTATARRHPTAVLEERALLLARVREQWIDGNRAPLRAVEQQSHSWHPFLANVNAQVRSLAERGASTLRPKDDSPLSLFELGERSILLTGLPGVGKSVWSWQLARALVDQAAVDPSAPIPLVLELSRWSIARRPMDVFIESELVLGDTQIRRETIRSYLRAGAFVLIFEGLDEVPPLHRERCVTELNALLLRQSWLNVRQPIVVTTRPLHRDGEIPHSGPEVGLRLAFAVDLLPRKPSAVRASLTTGGEEFGPLRAAVRSNPTLRSLMSYPLWWLLAVTASTGQDAHAEWMRERDSGKVRAHLIQSFLYRTILSGPKGPKVLSHLRFLATGMSVHAQYTFYLHNATPDWMPDVKVARRARTIVAIVTSIILGVATALTLSPGSSSRPLVGVPGRLAVVIMSLGIMGTTYRATRKYDEMSDDALALVWRWRPIGQWLPYFIRTIAQTSRRHITFCVAMGIAVVWDSSLKGISIGVIIGLFTWTVAVGAASLHHALLFSQTLAAPAGSAMLTTPGSALSRSLRLYLLNVCARVVLGALIGTVLQHLIGPIARHLFPELHIKGIPWPVLGAYYGLFSAIVMSTPALVLRVTSGIAGAASARRLPLRMSRFLRDSADVGLLFPAGSGYRFLHRTLQEHLSSQEIREPLLTVDGLLLRARRCLETSQVEAALEYADRALTVEPARLAPLLIRIEALLELGRVDEATATLEDALDTARDASMRKTLRTNMGWALLSLGQEERALSEFEEAVRLYEREAKLALVAAGVIQWSRGERDKAVDLFRRSLRTKGPVRQDVELLLASIAHLGLGDKQRAIQEAEEAIARSRHGTDPSLDWLLNSIASMPGVEDLYLTLYALPRSS